MEILASGIGAWLRNLLAGFTRMDGVIAVKTEAEIDFLARKLDERLKYEFTHMPEPNKAGRTTHDRTDTEDDRSQWDDTYVHTIDTTELHVMGMSATIIWRGGAPFVEYRQPRHPITATNDSGYLTFKGDEGWARVHEVDHPGYAGDPFVERAVHSVEFAQALGMVLSDIKILLNDQIIHPPHLVGV